MENSQINEKKKRYMVPITVTGHVYVYVDANSKEEAEDMVIEEPEYRLDELSVSDVFVGEATLYESKTNKIV